MQKLLLCYICLLLAKFCIAQNETCTIDTFKFNLLNVTVIQTSINLDYKLTINLNNTIKSDDYLNKCFHYLILRATNLNNNISQEYLVIFFDTFFS